MCSTSTSWATRCHLFQAIHKPLAPFFRAFFLAGLCSVPLYAGTRLWCWMKGQPMTFELMDFWTWTTECAALWVLTKALLACSLPGFFGGLCGLVLGLHIMFLIDSEDGECYPRGVVSRSMCFHAWQYFKGEGDLIKSPLIKETKVVARQASPIGTSTEIDPTVELEEMFKSVEVDTNKSKKLVLFVKAALKGTVKILLLVKGILELLSASRVA
ncbi:hypothetical protein HAT2_00689 [Candidatus Similichlamydia laticola]|uniref:Uncharacterized protein n=2 Tax=Candidatus Similichlamydia laticola TaxID=2170265 RepID=A0A369K9D7_9BACT|nr:hypothetical protein HAT2_00689 [Candidatus Similichlamydia laticola]